MAQLFGSCTMLAGGASSRMGRDKELISENTALILHELEAVFPQIIISTKKPELYAGRNVFAINDILPDCGPLGGIFSALCLCRSQYLFVLPCDMPNINRNMISFMQQRAAEELPDICLASSERGLEPLVGFYSKALLADMREFLLSGGRKLHTFLEKHNCLIIEADEMQQHMHKQTFANINHEQKPLPEDDLLTAQLAARRYNKKSFAELDETVAKERELQLFCNGSLCESLSYSPSAEKELVLGRLFTLGLLNSVAELQSLNFKDNSAFASVQQQRLAPKAALPKQFAVDKLIGLSAEFLSRSSVFEKTGGVHSAAVSDGEKLICFFEDIGRFNAVDKCIGYCLLHGLDMQQAVLYTSGRVAAQMAQKAANAGFPLIVSRAAPTDKAIALAKETQLALIAFARNGRFNMYCGYERVVYENE